MHCPDCGAYVGKEDQFCGECGRPLLEGVPPVESPDTRTQVPDFVKPPARPPEPPGVRKPSRSSPSPLPAAPAVAGKKRPATTGFVLAGVILLLLCLCAGGLAAWLLLAVDGTEGPTADEPGAKGPAVNEPGSGEPAADEPDPGAILYEEDFGDPASGWDTYSEDDTWADYVDGEYVLAVYSDTLMTWGNPEPGLELANFEIEVDARQVEGPLDNNFGLLVRYQPEEDSFYWFQISGDGYYFADMLWMNEWATLVDWETSEAINTGLGATNHLKVVCYGDRFSFYVNGTYLAGVADDVFGSGNVGLAVGTFDEPGVVVHFDNLRVRKLQE